MLANNRMRMTLFKGTTAESMRHNLASHIYRWTGNHDEYARMLDQQSCLMISNYKHFIYSFKGSRHEYEGVVFVSNLKGISDVEEFYQENRLNKETTFFWELRK